MQTYYFEYRDCQSALTNGMWSHTSKVQIRTPRVIITEITGMGCLHDRTYLSMSDYWNIISYDGSNNEWSNNREFLQIIITDQ